MSAEQLLNGVFNVVTGLLAVLVKVLWDAIGEVRRENVKLSEELHEHYVKRNEFTEAVTRIERSVDRMSERIMDRLGNSQDRLPR